jgi:YesN/AraC family two-component response regulator
MTVLIADDEDLARYAIKTLISRNYSDLDIIAEAADGEEAVRLADQNRPDLAILDIRMPVLDGLEAARLIRRNHPETAVLILSAYEDFSFAQQAVNAGVNGYLLKPVSPEDFASRLTAVRDWLSRISGSPEGAPAGDEDEESEQEISWRLERALSYIRNHIGEDLPLDTVADAAGISAQHLSRLFRDELNSNFVKFVTESRMDLACRLLDETTLGVAEIGGKCGFRDANYFAKVFRKSRSLSPLDYRNGVGLRSPGKE